MDRFRSVSGIPVLKMDRQNAESEMRWNKRFLISTPYRFGTYQFDCYYLNSNHQIPSSK